MSHNNQIPWNTQNTIGEILYKWKKNYAWQHRKNNTVKRVWDILPQNMLWNIWLARNQKVFKDKDSTVSSLCTKARSLALEIISIKNPRSINVSELSIEERIFIGHLLDQNTSNQKGNVSSNRNNNVSPNSKIRLKEEEFAGWLKNRNKHYLCFDGASKSNPGVAGAGGPIFNANGDKIMSYEWGLGHTSNNRAEALTLYQGLIQLGKLGIDTITILGDSAIVVSAMV